MQDFIANILAYHVCEECITIGTRHATHGHVAPHNDTPSGCVLARFCAEIPRNRGAGHTLWLYRGGRGPTSQTFFRKTLGMGFLLGPTTRADRHGFDVSVESPLPDLDCSLGSYHARNMEYGDIGSARGGRREPRTELIIEIVRGLTEEDLPALQSPDSLGTTPIPIKALRASHHQLAQMLAKGMPDAEAALITGYSPSRISILKKDPSFAELLATYQEVREHVFVDTLERMKVLGLSTLDELQERLETMPERWSNRELMEMADLLLVKPRIATPMGQGSTAQANSAQGVTVNVQFVKAETPPLVIEGKAELVPGGHR